VGRVAARTAIAETTHPLPRGGTDSYITLLCYHSSAPESWKITRPTQVVSAVEKSPPKLVP
jgi:hypothetical protein